MNEPQPENKSIEEQAVELQLPISKFQGTRLFRDVFSVYAIDFEDLSDVDGELLGMETLKKMRGKPEWMNEEEFENLDSSLDGYRLLCDRAVFVEINNLDPNKYLLYENYGNKKIIDLKYLLRTSEEVLVDGYSSLGSTGNETSLLSVGFDKLIKAIAESYEKYGLDGFDRIQNLIILNSMSKLVASGRLHAAEKISLDFKLGAEYNDYLESEKMQNDLLTALVNLQWDSYPRIGVLEDLKKVLSLLDSEINISSIDSVWGHLGRKFNFQNIVEFRQFIKNHRSFCDLLSSELIDTKEKKQVLYPLREYPGLQPGDESCLAPVRQVGVANLTNQVSMRY